jgi:formylglycine-generating enzyme required for sulfatase activity
VLFQARNLANAVVREGIGLAALAEAVAWELQTGTDQEINRRELLSSLRAGRYLLLIDSLDEVPDVSERQAVVQLLQGLVSQRMPSRTVLTTRPVPYTGVDFRVGLGLLRIARADSETVRHMAKRWCAGQAYDEEYKNRLVAAVCEVRSRHRSANITENPLLLTAAFLVYGRQEQLPNSAAELYDCIVDILCRTRQATMDATSKRQLLEQVFEGLQRAGGVEWPVREAEEWLVENRGAEFPTTRDALRVLEQLAAETGLLCFGERRNDQGRKQMVIRPWHRSFQEYLTACRLAAGVHSVAAETSRLIEPRSDRLAIIEDPDWEGVLRFLVGVHGQRGAERARTYIECLHDHAAVEAGRPGQSRIGRLLGLVASRLAEYDGSLGRVNVQRWAERARAYGERLHGHNTAGEADRPEQRRVGRLLGLVAWGLAEYGEYFPKHSLFEKVPNEIVHHFEENGANWPLADRILALDALGQLGDPRLDRDLWVELSGGDFTMGDDPGASAGNDAQRVRLGPFELAWRPVTVADFELFVDVDGYKDNRWWSAGRPEGANWQNPENWTQQLHHPNRPVTHVSWYEAKAFCAWATEHWRHGKDGFHIDLPTEAQWEYAARGPHGDRYPWGADEPKEGDEAQLSWNGAGVNQIPPVGAFPRGNRGQFADLVGGVFEWCLDKPTKGIRNDDERLMRGACWVSHEQDLPAAQRFGLPGWFRDYVNGFRVAAYRIEHANDRAYPTKEGLQQ